MEEQEDWWSPEAGVRSPGLTASQTPAVDKDTAGHWWTEDCQRTDWWTEDCERTDWWIEVVDTRIQ